MKAAIAKAMPLRCLRCALLNLNEEKSKRTARQNNCDYSNIFNGQCSTEIDRAI